MCMGQFIICADINTLLSKGEGISTDLRLKNNNQTPKSKEHIVNHDLCN